MNQILQQALSLAQSGVSVLPIRTDGSKKPAVDSWTPFQEEIAPPAMIKQWFGNGKDQGIAGICGEVSGKLEVIDIDAPELVRPFLSVAGEMGLGALLQHLPLIKTPSGGAHVLYRCSDGVQGNTKLARRRVTDEQVSTLIETRGERGYVILPGSPLACHPDGKAYQLIRGDLTRIPNISGSERTLLLSVARSFNEFFEEPFREPKTQGDGQRPMGDRPGDEFNRSRTWEEVLTPHGWTRVYTHGETSFWQRPGKKGPGISATANHKGRDLFYVFSTNAYPFDSEKSYSKFAAFAILEHGGDFKAAARGISGKERPKPDKTAAVAEEYQAEPVEWPVLDSKALYGLMGEIVESIGPQTEADAAGLLIHNLVAFGNSIGRSAHFRVGADWHFFNLFAVLVGDTSSGRKGTSRAESRRLFLQVDQQWAKHCQGDGLSTGEGLIWAVRDPIFETKPIRGKGTITGYEEVMIDKGIGDKRLLVVEGEFARVLSAMARDGNTLSAVMRQSWDGLDLRTMTKNQSLRSTGPHVSIVAHITSTELRDLMTQNDFHNGFANRMLWVCVRRSKCLPEGGSLSEQLVLAMAQKLCEAARFAGSVGRMEKDPEAKEVWAAVYPQLSAGLPGVLGAVTNRAEAQTMRLAGLYALLDQSGWIKVEHLTAALALWQYCEDSARFVFGAATGDALADRLLSMLREKQPDGLTRTEIRDALQRHYKAERIDRSLAVLEKKSLARKEKADTKGRPVEIWYACATKATKG